MLAVLASAFCACFFELMNAMWGSASDEVVQFFGRPDYEFDWTKMVDTLGQACVPMNIFRRFVRVQEEFFPSQSINWNTVMNWAGLVPTAENNFRQTLLEPFKALVKCKITNRLNAIGLKAWRDEIMVSIQSFDDGSCTMFKLELGSCMKRGNFLSNVDSKSRCQRYFLEP